MDTKRAQPEIALFVKCSEPILWPRKWSKHVHIAQKFGNKCYVTLCQIPHVTFVDTVPYHHHHLKSVTYHLNGPLNLKLHYWSTSLKYRDDFKVRIGQKFEILPRGRRVSEWTLFLKWAMVRFFQSIDYPRGASSESHFFRHIIF